MMPLSANRDVVGPIARCVRDAARTLDTLAGCWDGPCNSPVPRAFGTMDNKELKAGARLHLPVFNAGGLFMAGDGHGTRAVARCGSWRPGSG